MNEELAKRLHEAGFPMKQTIVIKGANGDPSLVELIAPDLIQLIQACQQWGKKRYFRLENNMGISWTAEAPHLKYRKVITKHGYTPEEAVSELFIALQEFKK